MHRRICRGKTNQPYQWRGVMGSPPRTR